jgi:glycosyltransferase involved in cell wall biosynthesis
MRSPDNKDFGFNVVGYVSGNLGLGVTARNVVEMLVENDFPVAILDVDPGLGRGRRDTRFERLTVPCVEALPYAVNLLIFPPPTLVSFVPQRPALFANSDRFNAAFTPWELPVVPPHWRPTLEFFDVLVAESSFIRHTLDVALSRTMIVSAQHPLYLPKDVAPDRNRFGLDPTDLVFVTSFELASDARRKNVLAVIEAFRRGLDGIPIARLLVRLNNAEDVSPNNQVVRALRDACERDWRIRLITEPLTYSEVLSLYCSSDIFVSLHRSEGLGLGPMEAMALGKVVIATAWSGNMDYMDHTNACLVPYKLIPATGATGGYSTRALGGLVPLWADPDVEHAAAWMRRVAEDRQLRVTIGGNAARSIARFHATAIKAKFAVEIKALWEHRQVTGFKLDVNARLAALQDAASEIKHADPSMATRFREGATNFLERNLLWRFRNL